LADAGVVGFGEGGVIDVFEFEDLFDPFGGGGGFGVEFDEEEFPILE
jgi:hypothetical protein